MCHRLLALIDLILYDCHEVEVDFAGLITSHALLNDWPGQIEPIAIGGNSAVVWKRDLSNLSNSRLRSQLRDLPTGPSFSPSSS